MPNFDAIVNLPSITVERVEAGNPLIVHATYHGEVHCPHCGCDRLRKKAKLVRKVKHQPIGLGNTLLHVQCHKYQCRGCCRYFNTRLPGILPRFRGSQKFKEQVYKMHLGGMAHKHIQNQFQLGHSTLERWFRECYELESRKVSDRLCPTVLGIDEHMFNKQSGYATTLCDLRKHRVFDVVKGKSQQDLKAYLNALPGKERVQVICIDLSSSYRRIIKQYFPNAKIVSDRFHVIRLVGYHFLKTCHSIDPDVKHRRSMLRILRMREDKLSNKQIRQRDQYFKDQPAIEVIYQFKQSLHKLLLHKARTKQQCKGLIKQLLAKIKQLKQSGLEHLITLAKTLYNWREEIVRMWRFTKSNGITEGFHRKMKLIQRRAYGFRNFENYRMRVRVLCG